MLFAFSYFLICFAGCAYDRPYIFEGLDKNENYRLKNATGEKFESNLPRHKLKVIQIEADENVF